MKYFLRYNFFLLVVLLGTISLYADDVIVKRNGDLVQAKILEITTTEIKYKKASNPNGPTYTLEIQEVLAINYENGEKDTFDAPVPQATETKAATDYSAPEANQKAMDAFDRTVPKYTGTDTDEKATSVAMILAPTEGSVIEDSNISISFKNVEPLGDWYVVTVSNKTNRTLYIDLGNTFTSRNNLAVPFYIPSSTSTTTSVSSGIGVNLGGVSPLLSGISVGTGTSTAKSTTVYAQRVVAIPPHSNINLPKTLITVASDNPKRKQEIEDFLSTVQDPGFYRRTYDHRLCLNLGTNIPLRGQVYTYSEEQVNFRIGFHLSYSLTEDCQSLISLSSQFYFKYLIGMRAFKADGVAMYSIDKIKECMPECGAAFGYWIAVKEKKNIPVYPQP